MKPVKATGAAVNMTWMAATEDFLLGYFYFIF